MHIISVPQRHLVSRRHGIVALWQSLARMLLTGCPERRRLLKDMRRREPHGGGGRRKNGVCR